MRELRNEGENGEGSGCDGVDEDLNKSSFGSNRQIKLSALTGHSC